MENINYYTKLNQIMEVPERKNNLFKAVLSSNATEISIEQRSQKWFQWRKEGVTATEAVVITKGEHFRKTVSTLFDEKTGKVEIRNISNQYIQRGIAFEESVLQFFSTHRNVRVKNSGCYQNKILPLLRCSLDGECIINGENFDLEVKCLSEKVFNELQQHGINSDTYRKYWIQIQYQLLVTGYKNAMLCCALVDIKEKGYVLYYTNQCPFNGKYVPILEEMAKKNKIKFKTIHIDNKKDAQNAPTPITTYALFYDGKYLTNEQMNEARFLKLINK